MSNHLISNCLSLNLLNHENTFFDIIGYGFGDYLKRR